jgi:hypothetical protein
MICDPSLAALFTPPRPEIGRYEVCTGPQTIEAALADEGAPGAHVTIDALEPLDAFGRAGPYDRAALARLYGGNRVQVARRWRQRGDEFIAETLLSPYPDAALSRLHPGTMAIRWIVTRR